MSGCVKFEDLELLIKHISALKNALIAIHKSTYVMDYRFIHRVIDEEYHKVIDDNGELKEIKE